MPTELRFSSSEPELPPLLPSVAAPSLLAAQWCARRGWPVHPLSPGHKSPAGNCSDCRENAHAPSDCACLPAGRWCHSFYAATLNQRRIQQWWDHNPEFGIGVSCGPAGLVVIDIDAHEAEPPARNRILPGIPIGDQVDLTGLATGFHTLAVLAALRGQNSPAEDTTTLRVRTPSGGLHVWYRTTGNRQWLSSVGSTPGRALAWQVDIRAHGSYIVAPGTTTQHGTYTPIGDTREPAALPLWLAQELDRTGHLPAPSVPAPRPVPPRAQQAVLTAGGGRQDAGPTLATILAPIAACGQVTEGAGFSDALNRAAYTLGGLIAAGRLSEEAEQALKDTAATARPGQELRIQQIIRSGLTAGKQRPLHASGRRP
ncbi:bifunctional DNA primase/polymerase [Streptomyces sp. D2-8]|uniref:bifunctional DNA primase/polymerase n=1 Tax=Streptomyces sp. D2-8 TaxID=2707767 RepID=UPI0020BEDAA2|nr:bifunctional DNA primase/polymerase [Streptomyces sp. D2-8]MCK8438843.1 bifunctional DNA primase/polymerase [Streptomyces sp. D2-8]